MLKDSVLLSGHRLLKSLSQLFILMILARTLTVTEMGIYQQILLIAIIVGALVPWEMQMSFSYFFNRTANLKEKHQVISNTFFGLFLLGTITLITFVALFYNGFFFKESVFKEYAIWLGLWCFAVITGSYLENLFVSSNRAKKFSLLMLGYYISYLSWMIFIIFASKDLLIIIQSISIFEAMRVIVLHIYFQMVEKVTFQLHPALLKEQIKYTLAVGSVTAITVLMNSTDKVLISLFFSVEAFAVFAIAAKEIPFMAIITVAVITAMLPRLGNLYNVENDEKAALALWKKTSSVLAAIIFPLFWILLFYNKTFISLIYSDVYLSASLIFIIYLLKFPLRFTVFYTLLLISGNQILVLKNTVIVVVLNIFLSLLFLWAFGYVGVAAATVLAAYIGVYLQQKDVCKVYKLKAIQLLPYKKILHMFIQSGYVTGAIYLLMSLLPFHEYFIFIISGFITMTAYLAIALFRREIELDYSLVVGKLKNKVAVSDENA